MTLGQRIAYLRERRSLSQNQLASQLHIGTSTLGMWETDKRRPNAEALVQLADFFETSTDYLLGRKTDLGSLPVAAHIADGMDGLSNEERKEIEDYIEFKKAQFKKRSEKKD